MMIVFLFEWTIIEINKHQISSFKSFVIWLQFKDPFIRAIAILASEKKKHYLLFYYIYLLNYRGKIGYFCGGIRAVTVLAI